MRRLLRGDVDHVRSAEWIEVGEAWVRHPNTLARLPCSNGSRVTITRDCQYPPWQRRDDSDEMRETTDQPPSWLIDFEGRRKCT